MSIQNKIDAYFDANFITKSTRKCNMHNREKYNYLMAYVDRLNLFRNNFVAGNPKTEIYTIAHRCKIATEIWKVQDKLKQLADKLGNELPNKYQN